ncbi:MAG: SDR family oxidoreductase [Elusimicrobia bacterium]|nr:SDR family oxidoreductase [Elusimicrobiota bacterium]
MKKPLWLVTGGAGFIGSNITEELVKRGERIRVFDNFSTGKKENLANLLDKIELIKGDIRRPADLKKAMKGVNYVLHQAALRSVPRSIYNPVDTNEVNITGTLNVLSAAKAAGVKRLVYASSSSAYGDCEAFPQKESLSASPLSPYAVSKLAAENYCMAFTCTYGFETVSLRYFNVFGPRQNPESKYSAVIPKFMEHALKDTPLEIHWDGRQSRDFTYVANVVDANIKAALAGPKAPGVYNIAVGSNNSLLDIVRELESLTGKKLKKNFLPKRTSDIRKTYADISKAKKHLGYKPLVGFSKGMALTWEYFKTKFS